ncbi:hypothetical protein RY831_04805 [Noviherbaspirillum sp. CPCC 100848]|uniref:Uncharacterized protein n=1 Tax=Noviherbaspirillum album TaxID=3080276 RepID=A0ABU6J5G4_9BURK|nr:hypothetical protein [Noviherbaspirillum sp. CPCC 100848]MEC4718454.1 hypothetical protein [Noviherbaspirillum sp. CPCC 100848]
MGRYSGAVIAGGSSNVFVGGGIAQTDPVQPENLVPGWVHAALLAVGLGTALVLGGPIVTAAGTFGGLAGGEVLGRVGERVFGAGSDGQKWSMLAGSMAGGFLGLKGVPKGLNLHVEHGSLGMSGGNLKFSPKYKTKVMDPGYMDENLQGNTARNWISNGMRVQVEYLSPIKREDYKINFYKGKVVDQYGALFDSAKGEGGRAIFVMDEQGNMYASVNQKVGKFHHSSLTSGGPVAAAGELEVVEGVITLISDRSGHYKPTKELMAQALQQLEENGVDMRYVFTDFD